MIKRTHYLTSVVGHALKSRVFQTLIALGVILTCQLPHAAPDNRLKKGDSISERYTTQLRRNYGLYSGPEAQQQPLTLMHINKLLKSKAPLTPQARSLFEVPFYQQLTVEGDQLVTTATLRPSQHLQQQKRNSFSVLGLNPAIHHACNTSAQRCWVLHPASHQPWLELPYEETQAKELSLAVSMLMLIIQSSGGA